MRETHRERERGRKREREKEVNLCLLTENYFVDGLILNSLSIILPVCFLTPASF